MAKIPVHLQSYIDDAFPKNVILVGTVLENGYAQVSPRGSVLVWDEETLAFWDRGRGQTHDTVQNGTKLTFYFRNTDLRDDGTLPEGGIARFYGTAELHLDGAVRDKVYDKMQQPERDRDPEKAGSAVLVRIERSEALSGNPLDGS